MDEIWNSKPYIAKLREENERLTAELEQTKDYNKFVSEQLAANASSRSYFENECRKLEHELEGLQNRFDDSSTVRISLQRELAATKRDNATLNLANHLPPRPKCPDCGIESLYGSVHTDECIKTSELREELERAKAENEKLHAILSELIEMYDIGFPMGDSKVYFNKARAALNEVSK